MIHKLPWWVGLGGMTLSLIAGVVNAVGFESFTHQGVTHVTGTTTQLGAALGDGRFDAAPHFALVIAAFFAGATLSGLLIHATTLKLGRRYGAALVLESLLLLLALLLLRAGRVEGEYVASVAAGLQNAMASMYSGAILRTTHVTGIVTDLGTLLGHRLRGGKVEGVRVRLLLLLLLGFFLGAVAGSLLFRRFEFLALLLPVAVTGIAGVSYTVVAQRALVAEESAS